MRKKDFYKRLPSLVCQSLDYLEQTYSSLSWFNDAWDEYRKHVLSSDKFSIKMPGFVFNKYVKGE